MPSLRATIRWAGEPVGINVVSLAMNAALTAAKVLAGVFCNSQAILMDGLHTASDAATDLPVLAGLRISGRPADASHPYGHRRATTLITMLLAIILLGAGGYLFHRSLLGLRDMNRGQADIRVAFPLAMAILTVVLKEWLYHAMVRVGRRYRDSSLVANAWHSRSDAAAALAATAGLAGVAVGGPAWHFLDHLTAMVLAAFLAVVAWRILRGAADELMDSAPGGDFQRRIAACVSGTEGVRSFHGLRARRLGGMVEMDVHVQVNPELSVRRGHDIARDVRRRITEAFPDVLSVIVHVEPAEQ